MGWNKDGWFYITVYDSKKQIYWRIIFPSVFSCLKHLIRVSIILG